MGHEVRKQIRGAEKKCPVCGETFWCYDVIQWAYRSRSKAGKKKGWICSWSCQAQYNREQEKPVKLKTGDEARPVYERRKHAGDADTVKYFAMPGLKDALTARNMTQSELAARIGAGNSAVSAYAWKYQGCPEDRVKLIAEAIGCTVEELIAPKNGEGTPS